MAVGEAHVFPAFLTLVLTCLPFKSHQLLFPHASAEVRGENTPKRNLASTGYRTHSHKVPSLTRSLLSNLGGLVVVVLVDTSAATTMLRQKGGSRSTSNSSRSSNSSSCSCGSSSSSSGSSSRSSSG